MSRKAWIPLCGVAFMALGALAASAQERGDRHGSGAAPAPQVTARRYAYPLEVSRNGRYLVDQRDTPFLIVGDSPQALIANLSVKDAATFIANRKRAGFNALWVNLLCVKYTGCRDDGTTYDGIKPFTKAGDLSTPNPAYFDRAEAILKLAEKAGLVVFLDPIETGGWLRVLRDNGEAKARAYGRFLGRRFAHLPNIVWQSGNDFQTWSNDDDDDVVLAVADGIRAVDHTHLQTVELDFLDSGSLDDPRWRPLIQLDAAYTYYPTYARVLREYNREPPLPVYMVEAGYEFEQNSSSISKGDPPILRRQEYWSVLSGATGQFYGNHYTWQFADGWQSNLDTTGSRQLGYLTKLFSGLRWFDLVPDQAHRVVTDGYGTFSSTGSVGSSDYVTSAATRDGALAISYLPNGGAVTVDMGQLARPVRARWYDPTDGTFRTAAGSPFRAARKVRLAPPGRNGDGDPDWVLVLTGASTRRAR